MANVYDVADFFIDWANKSEEEHMTNLWLNKLLYFAQGQYLARYGKPLFQDAIEAWDYGPVVPAIYRKYKVCGRNPISVVDDGYTPANFTVDEQRLLADVLTKYGGYSATALVSMTHRKNTPWRNAYHEGQNCEISKEAMQTFFSAAENKLDSFSSIFSSMCLPVEATRDADGYLVLPAEDDDGDDWSEL